MNGMSGTTRKTEYTMSPVGAVRRREGTTWIEIDAVYRDALKGLDGFSHAQIVWWFDRFDTPEHRGMLQIDPPFDAPPTGVFALKAPMRPNPIGISTVRIDRVERENGVVEISRIDAYDGTPVLDVKPYLPCYDRVSETTVPKWASSWPDSLPEEGIDVDVPPAS